MPGSIAAGDPGRQRDDRRVDAPAAPPVGRDVIHAQPADG